MLGLGVSGTTILGAELGDLSEGLGLEENSLSAWVLWREVDGWETTVL